MKTAVVILNYNGIKYLQRYLDCLIKNTPDCEIVITDNASTDQSVEWLRQTHSDIRLILLDKNYGFAEGYNRALAQIQAEYYMLLNSDIRTVPEWIKPLETYMDTHPQCAACQPKVLSELNPQQFEYAGAAGGFIDRYGYPFCRGRIFSHIENDNHQYDDIAEIFWATGAALMVRSEIYWAIGGLDGRFFAHQEEIDLCWRIKSRGHSIVCVPQSIIYHVGGGTLGYESPFKTKLNFRNNALLLYKNVTGKRYYALYPLRIALDMVAALQMLLQGKPRNAYAVIEGNIEFARMRKGFKSDRDTNRMASTTSKPYGILNQMLLWQVYIHRKLTFNRYNLDKKC